MESAKSLCKKLLDVKNTVISDCVFYTDTDNVSHIRIKARPTKWHENKCPYCHRRCSGYDSRCKKTRIWRGLDWGATPVEIEYQTHRIECPEHGVVVADVPWAYPGSGFTKDFDLTVAWFAAHLPRSVVAEYFRIDWETVGRCVSRTKDVIEPEISHRLDNLVHIGIDETSYKKGHKYITVIVNHDTNTVVWVSLGHGKSVLEKFYQQLTPEQRSSIKVVTGDGAKWITECVNEFTPDCVRCVDQFHVVQWASDTEKGAEASAAVMSIIETAKRNELDVYGYLLYLLTVLPKWGKDSAEAQLKSVMPWSMALPAYCRKMYSEIQ